MKKSCSFLIILTYAGTCFSMNQALVTQRLKELQAKRATMKVATSQEAKALDEIGKMLSRIKEIEKKDVVDIAALEAAAADFEKRITQMKKEYNQAITAATKQEKAKTRAIQKETRELEKQRRTLEKELKKKKKKVVREVKRIEKEVKKEVAKVEKEIERKVEKERRVAPKRPPVTIETKPVIERPVAEVKKEQEILASPKAKSPKRVSGILEKSPADKFKAWIKKSWPFADKIMKQMEKEKAVAR